MKTTVETKSETQTLIHVEIPPEVVTKKLQHLLQEVSRTFEVPGFRKGHIPRAFLESRFGKDFLNEDAQQQLIEEHLPKAIVENHIEPASRPQAKVIDFGEGKPFQFDIEVEIFPEVRLPDPLAIEVEAPTKRRITKKLIQETIENLKVDHATLIPRGESEASQANDVVAIRDDKGRTQEIQAREDGWMSELIGKKMGDSVELKSSDDETIRVKLDGVKRIELPDLEELAQSLGHANTDALQEEVDKQLKERAERDYQQALRIAILDNLVDQAPVQVPAQLVEELLQQDLEILRKNGHEATAEERDRLKISVGRRVHRDRILRAVRAKENISYTDHEFDEFLKSEAEKRSSNPVKFRALLEREGQLERIRSDQETQRVLDHLVGLAIIKKTAGKKSKKEIGEEQHEEEGQED
ncbi:trigger factor [Candidatus Acetothermia bacterium]|nr:trigger factor [Candidatus Acetothermia bacterium]MBI3643064.1 trigger factor [Candidatus Acetothermia bacterium]